MSKTKFLSAMMWTISQTIKGYFQVNSLNYVSHPQDQTSWACLLLLIDLGLTKQIK